MNTSNDVVAAWKAWVSEKNTPRRKMIVQIINALRLSYAWQAYDKAVENFRFMAVGPGQQKTVYDRRLH